jgi:chromosomal replication initiation ATPase DnaA
MPHDPRDLAFEVRLLRESIDALGEAIARGAKLAQQITSERKQIEALLGAFEPPRSAITKKKSSAISVPKGEINRVLDAVCHQWDVPVELLLSELRSKNTTYPRFAFCHIAHRLLGRSSGYVANILNRDHTTVLHACDRAEQLIDKDEVFSANYSAVITALKAAYTPTSDQMN